MIYLLDTNAWIEVLNHPLGHVGQRVANTDPKTIYLCSVVLGELYVGAYKGRRTQQQLDSLQKLLAQFSCLPFDEKSAGQFGQIREFLERTGQPIGPFDTQIAAIAVSNNLTLVTHNTREFARVPKLTVEDWLLP